MELKLNNIGKIKSATFEFNGITVIAGNNNTGKSTVGKALFGLFSKFNNIDVDINRYKAEAIASRVFKELASYTIDSDEDKAALVILGTPFFFDMFKMAHPDEIYTLDVILSYILQIIPDKFIDGLDNYVRLVYQTAESEVNELPTNRIKAQIITNYFNNIFDNQVNNLNSNSSGSVTLSIKDKYIDLTFEDNNCISVDDTVKLINKAIYVDDPYIIDTRTVDSSIKLKGRNEINNCLNSLLHSKDYDQIIEQIIAEDKYKAIEDKISLVIKGQLVLNQNGQYALKSKEYPEGINVSNLSTGLKSFLIIKKLIVDNLILTRDILILDEPEIHLHPEWQVVYAELLVLLQQYFDLTILLTTHSPFFLRAIEVFSKKYGITDKCKYYLANANVDTAVTFDEVTDTSVIYDKMANAFTMLNVIEDNLVDSES